jgi:hypothetical protein
MTGTNHLQTLDIDQVQEGTRYTANPTKNALNHNHRAGTITTSNLKHTTDPLKINREAERLQENALHTSEHTQATNLLTSQTGPRQVTHVVMTTNSDDATNGDAKKINKEPTNYMKKKVAEEQNIRKKKKKENELKITDAKCNDAPTA